jgi:hypothetical protein
MRNRVLVLVIAVRLTACADILGLGDFNGQDAGSDVTNDVTSEAAADVHPDISEAACASVPVDDMAGIFVAPMGSADSTTCGTQTVPCKSVQTGLDRAHVITGKSIVYVARGTYDEAVTLYAGLRLEGGWDVLDNGTSKMWLQACADPSSAAVLRSVTAVDLGGMATVATLTIRSGTAATGESLYGVFARGASTTVALSDVVIDVTSGGGGANGTSGAPGDAGASGCLLPADGAAGTSGSWGAGGEAGVFDLDGWVPASGRIATAGTAGVAGTMGSAGTCVACGTCQNFLGCSFKANGGMSCGGIGLTGCGGNPGLPGLPGGGGGSSIGVFAWDATITIQRGAVQVGSGGAGGSGGLGGAGGSGGVGLVGEAGAACGTSCNGSCNPINTGGPGGPAGGTGGAGGSGGTAGGGAGGCAYAIYQGGTGNVMMTGTNLAHGEAGAGGGPDGAAGAPGVAADRFP